MDVNSIVDQGNPRSLNQESFAEADRYKWILSERRGYDIGDPGRLEWYERFWRHYCRFHRIQHVVGECCWQEFNDMPSKFILHLADQNDILLDRIMDRLLCGWENLDLLLWGQEWGISMDPIVRILEELDINSARLDPPIATEPVID